MDKTAICIRTGKAALLAKAATVMVDCDAGNTITGAVGSVKPGARYI